MVVTFSLIHSGDSVQESKNDFYFLFIKWAHILPSSFCPAGWSCHVCSSFSSICTGFRLCGPAYWTFLSVHSLPVLESAVVKSPSFWQKIKTDGNTLCGSDWLKQQLWHMNSGNRLHTNSAGREMIICILTICDYSMFLFTYHVICHAEIYN